MSESDEEWDPKVSEGDNSEGSENGDPSDAPDLFKWLSKEVRELVPGRVPVLATPPTALEFSRDFVSTNRPCVIRGAFDHWPARSRWSLDYLSAVLGDTQISVNVTPTGLGDALIVTTGWEVKYAGQANGKTPNEVKHVGDDEKLAVPREGFAGPREGFAVPREVFAVPEERRMRFREFAEMLRNAWVFANAPVPRAASTLEIPYVSHQNDSFTNEFSEKLGVDLGGNDGLDGLGGLRFANDAFGHTPDAVNFWVGAEHATTSFHRDHYENVYCVLSGSKTFTLLPPCDAWRMKPRKAPRARFEYRADASTIADGTTADGTTADGTTADGTVTKASIAIDAPVTEISWPSATPESLAQDGGPPPIVVTVRAGETLYLPAMWFHHVSQARCPDTKEPAMAVNFWHDMTFDDRFAAAKFLEQAHARWGGSDS